MKDVKRIAVVGAGSSGLITLKYLKDAFPNAVIRCFEKGESIRGAWGNCRPDFVSTSTKYTTQFSCYREFEPNVSPVGGQTFQEFYRGREFGDYLERFADHFRLRPHIQLHTELTSIERDNGQWSLHFVAADEEKEEQFDAVFLCTGLVNSPKMIEPENQYVSVTTDFSDITNSTVVVMGGGESAVDAVDYLAQPEKKNRIFLSLRSGMRLSPRYHPIKGVPSDFLRNRLLLSIHEDIRNAVGDRFVAFRIKHRKLLERIFSPKTSQVEGRESKAELVKAWELRLKARAKDDLFQTFHNKSDRFLGALADGRVSIIGPASDESYDEFYDFDKESTLEILPDAIVPSIGYRSKLKELSGGEIALRDFYLGCVHKDLPNLSLIGFARPVIGNIPSISEMQARYTVGLLAKRWHLPKNIRRRHEKSLRARAKKFATVDLDLIYPVEHVPYCDTLAKEMDIYPSLWKLRSFRTWAKIMLSPASMFHYVDQYFDKSAVRSQPIYSPSLITALLMGVKCFDLPYKVLQSPS